MSQYTANQKLQNMYLKTPIMQPQPISPEKPQPPPPVIKEVPQITPKEIPIQHDVEITPPNTRINTAEATYYHSMRLNSTAFLEENY